MKSNSISEFKSKYPNWGVIADFSDLSAEELEKLKEGLRKPGHLPIERVDAGMKNDKQQDLEYGEVAIMSFTLPASKAEIFLDLVNQHNNHIRELLQMEDEGLSAGAQILGRDDDYQASREAIKEGMKGMEIYTTLNKIREYGQFQKAFNNFVESLNGRYGDDEPIPFSVMLEHTKLQNVMLFLRTVELDDAQLRMMRLYLCDCAERVLPVYKEHFPADETLDIAIYIARCYIDGEATEEELDAVGIELMELLRAVAEGLWGWVIILTAGAVESVRSSTTRDLQKEAVYSATWWWTWWGEMYAAAGDETKLQKDRLLKYLKGGK